MKDKKKKKKIVLCEEGIPKNKKSWDFLTTGVYGSKTKLSQ